MTYRLDKALEGRGGFRAAIASHNAAFEAVTRQVGVHCAERGELLARLQVKEVSSLAHTPILTPVACTPVPPPVANHANTDTKPPQAFYTQSTEVTARLAEGSLRDQYEARK